MSRSRVRRALASGAAAALLAGAAMAADDAAVQAERAEALMDRLYANHGDAALLKEADALVRECLDSGNYRTAEFVAGQVVYHRPNRLEDRHLYQRILIAKGDRAQAEKDLRDSLRERPSDCASYAMLADLLREGGRSRDAVAVHEAHLREHANEAGALYAISDLAIRDLRDHGLARDAARRMRAAAGAAGVPPRTAEWFRRNADLVEADVARLEKDRDALRAAEGRVAGLLRLSLAAAALALAGLAWMTRRRA
jgi:predicted Zn-dependent protease